MTEGDDFEPPDDEGELATDDVAAGDVVAEDEDDADGHFGAEREGTMAFAKLADADRGCELAAAVAATRLESRVSNGVAEVLPASEPAGATLEATTNVPTTATESIAAKARVDREPAMSRPRSMLPPWMRSPL